ncbi:daunorubicin resistance ABC transporter ATP-binding subunit [Caldisphaera lagunensis DSM 15908]|uniref:Daunorubicin resistance ABC transporter ATP-binding subunit n=1 Tax=Caldisphaera lagunensis (strain DSM 15908 / JCM 11604 / ANMR 0165 / IC-154) TaxID=1056495 RepID=L0A9V0_CALLD|nr:daunorubicin resistance protein DrrA family ABC transporter ATP-binding protein [Caldisphaera lagunensis]AFZ70626.1 daunorubicin resistance ABC transporter ATP-binding subunit [Caldisphaera lagunensis DSM 15908]
METVIEVKNLTKKYGDFVAVDHINFNINKGEVFSLLGPNGAGKTTTIGMLSTIKRPTEGDAFILGHSIVKQKYYVRKLIGVSPQDLTADDELTGYENVLIMAKLFGYRGKDAEERAKWALEFMDLWDSAFKKVREYSGGMRRRLEVSMSIVHNPAVVFLDEPTVGLDVQSRRHIWELIRDLKKNGTTVLLTTHYMEEAESLSDRVAIIDHGKIIAIGTPDELKAKIKGDRIYVTLKDTDHMDEIIAKINDILPNSTNKVDGQILIKTESSSEFLPQLIKILSDHEVVELKVVKPNLEEVFLELTGKGLKEDEGGFDRFKYMRVVRGARR